MGPPGIHLFVTIVLLLYHPTTVPPSWTSETGNSARRDDGTSLKPPWDLPVKRHQRDQLCMITYLTMSIVCPSTFMQLCRRPITILQLRHIEQVFWQPTVRQVQPEMTFWNRRGTSRYSNSLSPLFYCCTTQRLEAGVIQSRSRMQMWQNANQLSQTAVELFLSYIRKVFSNSSFCFSLHLPQ